MALVLCFSYFMLDIIYWGEYPTDLEIEYVIGDSDHVGLKESSTTEKEGISEISSKNKTIKTTNVSNLFFVRFGIYCVVCFIAIGILTKNC